MIKTDENSNIPAESQPIFTEPFQGGGTSNFGHAKSTVKYFARFPTFHFQGAGGMLNFGHAKSTITIFCQTSNFSFPWGGGGYVCHNQNVTLTLNPTFSFLRGGTSARTKMSP